MLYLLSFKSLKVLAIFFFWLPFIYLSFLLRALDGYQVFNYIKYSEGPKEIKYCYQRGPWNWFLRINVVSCTL